jgi:hypothetical protein
MNDWLVSKNKQTVMKEKKRKLRKHGEVVRLLGKRRRKVGGACIWWIDSSAAE